MDSAYHYVATRQIRRVVRIVVEAEAQVIILCCVRSLPIQFGVKHAFTTLEQLFVHDNQNRLLLHPSISVYR